PIVFPFIGLHDGRVKRKKKPFPAIVPMLRVESMKRWKVRSEHRLGVVRRATGVDDGSFDRRPSSYSNMHPSEKSAGIWSWETSKLQNGLLPLAVRAGWGAFAQISQYVQFWPAIGPVYWGWRVSAASSMSL